MSGQLSLQTPLVALVFDVPRTVSSVNKNGLRFRLHPDSLPLSLSGDVGTERAPTAIFGLLY